MSGTFDYFWAPDEGVDVDDIRALVPFVVEKAPSTDPNEVRRALASAVNSFLTDSGCWRKEGAPAYAMAGEVKVSSGGCARIVSVESITRVSDDTVVFSTTDAYRSPSRRPVRDDGQGGFVLTEPNAKVGDQYTSDLTLTVRLGSELCPVWVMERWGEAIACKAAHDLIAKGQPGSSTYLSAYTSAVQSVIARRAMGGSSRSSGPGSALSGTIERI